MLLSILLTAVTTVIIYRLGLCDGQATVRGERLKSTVTVRRKNNNEDERLKRGLKNILDYGMGEQ